MAEGFSRRTARDMNLATAALYEASEEYRRTVDRYVEQENVREFTRYIQSLPITDTEKKHELAAFFAETNIFSREEREQGYNDLLGRERNSRQRG